MRSTISSHSLFPGVDVIRTLAIPVRYFRMAQGKFLRISLCSPPAYEPSLASLLPFKNSPIHDRHSDSLHPLVTRVANPHQHHHLSGIPGFVNRLDQSQIPACQDFAHAGTFLIPPPSLSASHISNSSHHQLSDTGVSPHELGTLDDWFGICLLTTPPREGSSVVS